VKVFYKYGGKLVGERTSEKTIEFRDYRAAIC